MQPDTGGRAMDVIQWAETGWIPDWVIRIGIRKLLGTRIRHEQSAEAADAGQSLSAFAEQLRNSPLAVHTDEANTQHYEVPAEFFETVLGPRLKYSCCLFSQGASSLQQAECDMLALTCERADLQDGMKILELGCGWGSLTIWMAEQYPQAQIVAVSNSHGQRRYIEQRCRALGLGNVEVITCDVCDFDTEQRFDRVVSVEMFEHMRNYQELLRRISTWLLPGGSLFVHVFCHRELPYLFETEGAANWMGRHFFTGGMMPSEDLLPQFQDDLKLSRSWRVNGLDYATTCEAWLQRLDAHYATLKRRFAADLGDKEAARTLQRWRMFFMSCAELFRYRDGREWYVAHYLFHRAAVDTAQQAST
jgi:cyclopropane-fatty-acyl-phospholipid synthase